MLVNTFWNSFTWNCYSLYSWLCARLLWRTYWWLIFLRLLGIYVQHTQATRHVRPALLFSLTHLPIGKQHRIGINGTHRSNALFKECLELALSKERFDEDFFLHELTCRPFYALIINRLERITESMELNLDELRLMWSHGVIPEDRSCVPIYHMQCCWRILARLTIKVQVSVLFIYFKRPLDSYFIFFYSVVSTRHVQRQKQ